MVIETQGSLIWLIFPKRLSTINIQAKKLSKILKIILKNIQVLKVNKTYYLTSITEGRYRINWIIFTCNWKNYIILPWTLYYIVCVTITVKPKNREYIFWLVTVLLYDAVSIPFTSINFIQANYCSNNFKLWIKHFIQQ